MITGGRLGIGGLLLLGVLSIVFRQNFFALVGDDGTTAQAPGPQADQRRQAEAPLEKVAVATFNDAQQVWKEKIRGYREAKLVLFWDEVQSRCGEAAAEMGPFYCPADERVYIDLGFYRELSRRFGAPGDFAQAYVIAHEEGHHVQHVLGIGGKVQRAMQQDPSRRNALSVRLELQADCFAGVWGHSASRRQLLDPGDLDEGLRAAAADAVYTVKFCYRVIPNKLSTSSPYPYGGAMHAETVLESCLAMAEKRMGDADAVHMGTFLNRLQTSIGLDGAGGTEFYGYNGDRSTEEPWLEIPTRNGSITYNGVTL